MRCIYCGCKLEVCTQTKEHIVPKSLLKNLDTFMHGTIQINQPIYNVAPCCYECNMAKRHKFIMPTSENIKTAYINTPSAHIKSVAKWIIDNKVLLRIFFTREERRDFYNTEIKQLNNVIFLNNLKYYDRLSDIKRGIPNNKFNREYITLK